jgi:hypothetical protein
MDLVESPNLRIAASAASFLLSTASSSFSPSEDIDLKISGGLLEKGVVASDPGPNPTPEGSNPVPDPDPDLDADGGGMGRPAGITEVGGSG